jgi:hypothetical protein
VTATVSGTGGSPAVPESMKRLTRRVLVAIIRTSAIVVGLSVGMVLGQVIAHHLAAA